MLVAQTRRMLRDARVRRLATEFACQWLHIHDFDTLDEKSERHFPDVRRPARRDVRRVDPVLHRPVSERRLGARHPRRRPHVPERSAGEALRHPRRDRRRVAARRRRQAVRPRRHPRPGDDAGQAIGRLAHQPDPARQLGQRSAARRASCRVRPRTCRCCPRTKRPRKG